MYLVSITRSQEGYPEDHQNLIYTDIKSARERYEAAVAAKQIVTLAEILDQKWQSDYEALDRLSKDKDAIMARRLLIQEKQKD